MRALDLIFILSLCGVVYCSKIDGTTTDTSKKQTSEVKTPLSSKTGSSIGSVKRSTPSTNQKGIPEDDSSDEAVKDTSSSWSLDELIANTKAQLNAHIAKLTNSAQQTGNSLVDQTIGLVETTTQKANNRMLVGRVYSALTRASAKQHLSVDQMVEAFSIAISAELHSWMPIQVNLPSLEMKEKMKYMCGAGGRISNLQTMSYKTVSYGDVAPEDKTIEAVLTYSFQYLHMTYDHYGESTFLTFPVTGNLDLEFKDNEVELELDIPNVSVLSSANLEPECLISVKSFKVTRLAVPYARIEPASAYRLYAERMVNKFLKWHEAEFQNLFRMGVVQSFHDLLQAKSKWICNSEKLQKIFEVDDKNVMKPQDPGNYEKYCGEKATKDSKEKLNKQESKNTEYDPENKS